MQRLEVTPVEERRELLVIHVQEQAAKVLGVTLPKQIGLRESLLDLGIDSLMAVESRNHLQSSLGKSISSTVLFDYPTLEKLVDHLVSDVLSLEFFVSSDSNLKAPEPEADSLDQFKDQLQEMSQDEIANLFAQKLSSLKGENIK
jgi:myxalamid-type polyketide synthase MxaB